MLNPSCRNRAAFTLIELAIVLVIIGLVTGGILVGRDLIRTASIRAQIGQMEKFNTAVNAFRGKYGYFPGDILPNTASAFGMAARAGTANQGDGDGIVAGCTNSGGVAGGYSGCESLLFWNDLSFSGLIPGSFTLDTDGLVVIAAGTQSRYFPQAKINAQDYVAVLAKKDSQGACNSQSFCYVINTIQSTLVTGEYQLGGVDTGLAPGEAYAMDSKMDDGAPSSGRIIAGPGWSGMIIPEIMGMGGDCVTVPFANASYMLDASNVNKPECAITIAY